MIRCRTHIALGSGAQDTAKGHGALTDPKVVQDAKDAYGWTAGPFEVPSEIKLWWEEVGRRGDQPRGAWEERLAALPQNRRAEWDRTQKGEPPRKLASTVKALKRQAVENPHPAATRKASEAVLEVLAPIVPEAVGGSADLTGSNNTRVGGMEVFAPDDRSGRYVHYGIREHGMAAAMNGLAIHGGLRPYGGTFLCFADYARPAIRLSSLMGAPVVYVMSHDSIGLGEDGPTHQPVEQLAMLRATPNTLVIRPADMVETAEAWQVALEQTNKPTILALSRQTLRAVRTESRGGRNQVARGAYVLAEAEGRRHAVLLASGSEVEIALDARERLAADGIGARVVSMPCMELFAAQDESYRRRVLPGRARARGRRGRRAPALGPLAPRRARARGQGGLRRHGPVRRLGPGRAALRGLRHHRRGRRRARARYALSGARSRPAAATARLRHPPAIAQFLTKIEICQGSSGTRWKTLVAAQ